METHSKTRFIAQCRTLVVFGLQLPIRFYQFFISPWLGKNCRFEPSCSCYAHHALALHGPIKGLWLSVRRILKCHPWHPGGYDEVPPSFKKH